MTEASRRLLRRTAAVVIVLLVAGTVAGAIRAWSVRRSAAAESARASVPVVAVETPHPADARDRVELPGTLSPALEATIYARTSGYLARLHADIGQRVRAGDLLAEIDTPEVNQQLSQARAQLEQAVATRDLARLSATRARELRTRGLVAQQDEDEKKGALNQAEASVRAAQANVDRLRDLQSFSRVTAPFDGVITRRDVDRGTLVDAGGTAANRELFALAQTDPLKVFVNVPQADAPAVRPGVPAWIELTEFPGRRFPGKVTRTAGALDEHTRTMRAEIDLPNGDGTLLAGAYARVFIDAKVPGLGLRVPVPSLLFRPEGPRVAVVRADGTVTLKAVTLGRTTGTHYEVRDGLEATDRVVLNPGDSIQEGQHVEVRAAEAPKPDVSPGRSPGK
jgi:RND family efflux transporter MFP subunit